MGFPPLCSEKSALSSETFAFFETTISFSGACNISVYALGATSSEICTRQRCKTWMVSAILGRWEGTPSWTKCREKNYNLRTHCSTSARIACLVLKWLRYSLWGTTWDKILKGDRKCSDPLGRTAVIMVLNPLVLPPAVCLWKSLWRLVPLYSVP